ncbi:unnamed protein product [Notodromas monacha]|uniref:Syndecan/Neurexin domain-containing protein n=1 Tax=Notodromas monacha TaxID=399045 RepID=A0A7R9BE53_9CRUS|nr:unnamed protein product [Notodromas monacha]CAG0913689.1 unnamed protein product [Notodromas monacha]
MLLKLAFVGTILFFSCSCFVAGEAASSTHAGWERGATEGSGDTSHWPDGINDDEDDVRGRSNTQVEGSGGVPSRKIDDDDLESAPRGVEGSGDGSPAITYPKPNDNVWETPWKPAAKPDSKSSGKNSGNVNKNTNGDITLPGSINEVAESHPGGSSSSGDVNAADSGKPGQDVHIIGHVSNSDRPASFFAQPGILAAVIGGVVVGLLCTVLLLMYIVYRMRKMDEGSYPLEEPRKTPSNKQSQEIDCDAASWFHPSVVFCGQDDVMGVISPPRRGW